MEANHEFEQYTKMYNSLLPTNECDIRLDFAETFERLKQEEVPGWQFTPETFAAFLIIPLDEIKCYLSGNPVDALRFKLESLADATRYFLQLSQDDALCPVATPQHEEAAQPSQQGRPLGQTARIIPFAWNSNETQRTRTECWTYRICEMFDISTDSAAFLWVTLGSGDKEWNLMPMSPETA